MKEETPFTLSDGTTPPIEEAQDSTREYLRELLRPTPGAIEAMKAVGITPPTELGVPRIEISLPLPPVALIPWSHDHE